MNYLMFPAQMMAFFLGWVIAQYLFWPWACTAVKRIGDSAWWQRVSTKRQDIMFVPKHQWKHYKGLGYEDVSSQYKNNAVEGYIYVELRIARW